MAAKRSAGQPPAKRSRHQARSYHSLDRLLVYKLDRPVEMIQRARGATLRASGAGWIATDICRYRSSDSSVSQPSGLGHSTVWRRHAHEESINGPMRAFRDLLATGMHFQLAAV